MFFFDLWNSIIALPDIYYDLFMQCFIDVFESQQSLIINNNAHIIYFKTKQNENEVCHIFEKKKPWKSSISTCFCAKFEWRFSFNS